MERKYKHLTAESRGMMQALLKEGHTQTNIAQELGVNKSTISREIKKRSTPNGYISWVAQTNYETKRSKCKRKSKLSNRKLQRYVCSKLENGWSPEQIAGRLKLENSPMHVCHETIYEFIYKDNFAKREKLCQYLRYGHKKRKKQTGRSVHKSRIPNRVSISQRPKIVEKRIEYGHCEGDSVIYPYKHAINTVNELITGKVAFTKLTRKTADLTARALTRRLAELDSISLTIDNGSEFMKHEEITRTTGVPVYFADPYSSWQRGANENVNMLLRGYLPKRHDIRGLTQEELDDIAEELNSRPRKRLGYYTPNEIDDKLKKGGSVALATRI
jgi:IS30 family transposase